MQDKHMTQKGFTLVEMSIVLVIIGLLAGSIVAGQSLIKAAKLRNAVLEVDNTKKAVRAFREQYADLPGDLPTATQIWGAADGGDGTGSDCIAIQSTAKTTCNGDGDGLIEQPTATTNEKMRAWQQLTNSGLLEGHYTGAYNGSGNLEAKTNSPAVPYNNGLLEMHYQSSALFGRIGHFIKMAAANGSDANNALLNPIDAQSLDEKYDDGSADTGGIVALDAVDKGNCVTNGTSLTAPSNYILTNEEPGCRLYFWLD